MDWTNYYSGEPSTQDYRDIVSGLGGVAGEQWLSKYDLVMAEKDRKERQAVAELAMKLGKVSQTGQPAYPDIMNIVGSDPAALEMFASDLRKRGLAQAKDLAWQRNEGITGLSPGAIDQQRVLAKIQNDYAALAGKSASAPGAGYLEESPQVAQQNALRNLWGEEMNKRMGTANYDPRYAQNATSFAPNQFNAQANVYVDPFIQYGPLGAMREMVRSTTGKHFPGMTDELGITTQPTNYIRPTEGRGQWVQPNEQMPEMPSTRKGIMEKLKLMDTQRQKAVESEMAARQKAQAAQRAAQEKALEKAEAAYKKYLLQLMNKGDYVDYKTGGLNKEGLRRLVLGARIYNTRDWQEAGMLAHGDPDLQAEYFLKNHRLQWDSAYRKQLQKQQEQQKRAQEEARTNTEQNRDRIKKMVRQYYSPVPLNEPAQPRQPRAVSLTPPERLPKFTWQGAKYPRGQELWPANALPDLIDFLTPPQVKMPWDNRIY